MSDPPRRSDKTSMPVRAKGAKPNAEKLAQTLRVNLKRRKDAARKLADKSIPDAANKPQGAADSDDR